MLPPEESGKGHCSAVMNKLGFYKMSYEAVEKTALWVYFSNTSILQWKNQSLTEQAWFWSYLCLNYLITTGPLISHATYYFNTTKTPNKL